MGFERPGSWDFDPDDDFLVVEGLEEISLFRQLADGSYDAPYDCRGVREVPAGLQGLVGGFDLTWHVHAPDYPFTEVVRGDKLRDSQGVEWVVQTASLAGASDQWLLRTTKAVGAG